MPQIKDTIRRVVTTLVKPEKIVIQGAENLKKVQEAAKETAKEIQSERE